jgi:ribosomal protein L33
MTPSGFQVIASLGKIKNMLPSRTLANSADFIKICKYSCNKVSESQGFLPPIFCLGEQFVARRFNNQDPLTLSAVSWRFESLDQSGRRYVHHKVNSTMKSRLSYKKKSRHCRRMGLNKNS